MNENVKAVLNGNLWDLATVSADGTPNVIPVAFKTIIDDNTLAVGDVFLGATLANLEANPKIAVSAYNAKTMEGYQIKGSAKHLTDGPVVEKFKEMIPAATNGGLQAKGALVITVESVIVTTPGPDNKKVL